MSVLTSQEVEQFVEQGFVILREAFSPEVAAGVRQLVWDRIGLSPERPEEWTQPLVHLKETVTGPEVDAVFTPRLNAGLDEVMGQGRWIPVHSLGWWPVSFPGFDAPPWQGPTTGWHVDGIQFHHRLNSPDQGLLPIMLLSDIDPGGGGTAVRVSSHKVCARILSEAGEAGLDVGTLAREVSDRATGEAVEVTGQAGDVALVHPFLLHARSANTGSRVRFICNPCYALHEPMQFDRKDLSPVEQAIVNAL